MSNPFAFQPGCADCGCTPAQVCGCFGTDPSAVPTILHLTITSSAFGQPVGPTSSVLTGGGTGCAWTSADAQLWVLTYSCASGTWVLGTRHVSGTGNCGYSLVAPYSNAPNLTFTIPVGSLCTSTVVVTL